MTNRNIANAITEKLDCMQLKAREIVQNTLD